MAAGVKSPPGASLVDPGPECPPGRGGGWGDAGDPFAMTRKGREQSRGLLVPFHRAIPEPY
eukprot:662806-Prymnesium_polylepis.1